MNRANQRVVFVTGASSGVGRCCASFLSERGYCVYGASRSAPDIAELAASGVTFLRMDIVDEASVSQAVETVLERQGRLDVVVNNAGIGIAGAVEDTSIEEARAQFDVNFLGALRVCRAVLPIMRRQGDGYIINIGSIGGLIGLPYQGLYSASKFALEGLTESLRLEVRSFGINVVLIEPGDHRTAFTHNRRSTAASSGNTVYRERFDRAIGRMASDEQGGPDPDGIARLVHKVINSPSPRLRYTVGLGSQRAAVWLKRMMPYSVIEKMMALYYGR